MPTSLGRVACACASSTLPGSFQPRVNPPSAAAVETTKPRRLRVMVLLIVASLRLAPVPGRDLARRDLACGRMDRGADALVGAAAADVGHRRVDVGIGRLRLLLQQRDGGHDLAGLAVAAL